MYRQSSVKIPPIQNTSTNNTLSIFAQIQWLIFRSRLCKMFENEKIISQIAGDSEVTHQNGDRVPKNDKSCNICSINVFVARH